MTEGKQEKTKYPGVYQRIGGTAPDGKPEITFYIKYRKPDEKQVFEKAGRRSERMTAARANNLRADRVKGIQPSNTERRTAEREKAEPWTIIRLWEEYKARRTSLKGLIPDENRFTKHISESIGSKTPAELTPLDIDNVRTQLSKTHTPGTVKNVLELVRRIINFGVNEHLCAGISFRVRLPKVNNETTEFMSDEEMARYIQAVEEEVDIQGRDFLKLALFTGMRKGELLKLQWNDIDFERGFLAIRDPKGGRDENIPLNDAAIEVLRNHPHTASGYVFPGRDGRKRSDFKRIANRVKKRAGLPEDFRPLHGLRHNFASVLASSGEVDMYTLQKLMTHKSPQMTQRYAHLRDETLRKASNVIARKHDAPESST